MPHGVCGAIGACAVLHTRHRLSIVSAADIANLHCVYSAVQVFQCLRFPMQNFKFNKNGHSAKNDRRASRRSYCCFDTKFVEL